MRRSDLGILAAMLAVAAAIAVGTLGPAPAGGLAGNDKLSHFAAFAALVLPAAIWRPGWLWLLVPLALGFGAAIEVIQPFAGRARELADWVADAGGVALGMLAGRAAAWTVGLARR